MHRGVEGGWPGPQAQSAEQALAIMPSAHLRNSTPRIGFCPAIQPQLSRLRSAADLQRAGRQGGLPAPQEEVLVERHLCLPLPPGGGANAQSWYRRPEMHTVLEDKSGVPHQFWGPLTKWGTQRKVGVASPQMDQAMPPAARRRGLHSLLPRQVIMVPREEHDTWAQAWVGAHTLGPSLAPEISLSSSREYRQCLPLYSVHSEIECRPMC